MKNKTILIILVLIFIVGIKYWSYQKTRELPQNSSATLDKERQDCIDKYGTKEDPLGLSDNADPKLIECMKQVDPNNPLGI